MFIAMCRCLLASWAAIASLSHDTHFSACLLLALLFFLYFVVTQALLPAAVSAT
jgi:hypothetical protein